MGVMRLHKVFGSQDLNANAGQGIEIVQFLSLIHILRVGWSVNVGGVL